MSLSTDQAALANKSGNSYVKGQASSQKLSRSARRRRRKKATNQRMANNKGKRSRNNANNGNKVNGQTERRSLLSMLPESVISFAEAVVNPFGEGALGAFLPDTYRTPSMPAVDRITIDLDPTMFTGATSNPITALSGFVIALVPRSVAIGWFAENQFNLSLEASMEAEQRIEHAQALSKKRLAVLKAASEASLTAICDSKLPDFEDSHVPLVKHDNPAISTENYKGHPGYDPYGQGSHAQEDLDNHPVYVNLIHKGSQFKTRILKKRANLIIAGKPFTKEQLTYYRACRLGLGVSPDLNINVLSNTFGVTQDNSNPLLDLYCIVISAIGTVENEPTPGYHSLDASGSSQIQEGINVMQFSRTPTLVAAATSARVLGAGLKVWSDEAPLITGGTVYGGWIPVADLYNSLAGLDGFSAAGTLQDSLRYRSAQAGRDGITVRYSSLQSPINQQIQKLDLKQFYEWNNEAHTITLADSMDLSVYDQINSGDHIPCVVWRYNSTGLDDAYSLRIEARVHLQSVPNALSPFMTITPTPSMSLKSVDTMLENKRVFPVAVKGHSFASFWNTVKDIGSTVVKGVGMVAGVAKVAAEFAEAVAPLVL